MNTSRHCPVSLARGSGRRDRRGRARRADGRGAARGAASTSSRSRCAATQRWRPSRPSRARCRRCGSAPAPVTPRCRGRRGARRRRAVRAVAGRDAGAAGGRHRSRPALRPGVATAGEAMAARDAGFTLLKCFPAAQLGGVGVLRPGPGRCRAALLPDRRRLDRRSGKLPSRCPTWRWSAGRGSRPRPPSRWRLGASPAWRARGDRGRCRGAGH